MCVCVKRYNSVVGPKNRKVGQRIGKYGYLKTAKNIRREGVCEKIEKRRGKFFELWRAPEKGFC